MRGSGAVERVCFRMARPEQGMAPGVAWQFPVDLPRGWVWHWPELGALESSPVLLRSRRDRGGSVSANDSGSSPQE